MNVGNLAGRHHELRLDRCRRIVATIYETSEAVSVVLSGDSMHMHEAPQVADFLGRIFAQFETDQRPLDIDGFGREGWRLHTLAPGLFAVTPQRNGGAMQ